MKKIVFIPDFNSIIGTGHLSRCLNLANLFALKGCEIYFFVPNEAKQIVLDNNFYLCDSYNIEQDLTVVDNYFLDEEF